MQSKQSLSCAARMHALELLTVAEADRNLSSVSMGGWDNHWPWLAAPRFYRDLRTSDMLRVQEMCNEYKEILAAMSSGDAEQAESVMRKHVCNSLGTAHGG
jgi:DNA-binding FadR family transcriptional regulator